MNINAVNKNGYLQLELDNRNIPTIGANGFLIRREFLLRVTYKPYLFDIDILHQLVEDGRRKFAKVEIGIIHLFAERTRDFVRKQRRRIQDYLYFKKRNMRRYPWQQTNTKGLVKFILSTIFVLPLILDSFHGYIKIRDRAWFFHPLACWITLLVYGSVFIREALTGETRLIRNVDIGKERGS